jgi:ligand-binding sensor domain-containing protein
MKIRLFFLFFSYSLYIFAQNGDFFLTHYTPAGEQIENENFAIIQDLNGQMYFANSKGVLKFDGKYWTLIKTPSTALSLSIDSKGKIFVGCLNDFGFLDKNEVGIEQYKSIYHSPDSYSTFSEIVIIEDNVYFKGDSELFQYSISQSKITAQWSADILFQPNYIFSFKNKLHISDKQKGIFILENGKIKPSNIYLPAGTKVIFAIETDKLILGTDANEIFNFASNKLNKISLEASTYLNNSIFNDAILVPEGNLLISTNKGGCVLINPNSGKTLDILNYYSGLLDDEVFAIGKDAKSGIWIAHEFGFTRADFYLPFKTFSTYPGLEGHLEAAISYQDKLYVATSEGVYYLDKVKDYSEVIQRIKIKAKDEGEENREGKLNTFVRKQKDKFERIKNFFGFKKKKKNTDSISVKQQEKSIKSSDSTVQKKRKFLGIFNRKEKNNNLTEPQITTNSQIQIKEKIIVKKVGSKSQTGKTNFEISSVKYIYKKIQGINAKCRQLAIYEGKLLVATNNGMYEIEGIKSKKINEYAVSYFYLNNNGNKFYIGTDDKRLFTYSYQSGNWKKEKTFENFLEEVTNITEDDNQNIWISGNNSIFKYAQGTEKIDTIPIQNPFSDDINLVFSNGKLKVIISTQVYIYEPIKQKLVLDTLDEIGQKGFKRLIHSQNNIVWYNDGMNWKYASDIVTPNSNFVFLRLFKDLQDIFIDKDKKHCWVITKGNNLYNFNISSNTENHYSSNIFLRSVANNEGKQLTINDLEIDADKSYITFNFINTEYLDNNSLEYQYKLDGLMNEWSEWSGDNSISFNSLSSGKYELLVRTRNSLNEISESKLITFKVNPPYWQQWWFFLLEVTFFGSLMVVSIWLNKTKKVNAWVTRVLTFITIVFLIEFVDTIIASFIHVDNSPVLSFLVQVGIALLILPFERVLSGIISNKPRKAIIPIKKRA